MRKSLKISKFIKTIVKVVFILILIALLSYNIMNINNEEEYVSFIVYKIFVVKDYQKQDTIKEDTIIIAKTKNNKIQINDLVAIKMDSGIYFHKIIDIIGNEKYITKAIDNYKEDSFTFSHEEIEGKVVKQIPWFGKVLNIAKTKTFSVIILSILIMVYTYNKHIHIKINKRRLKQKYHNNNNLE